MSNYFDDVAGVYTIKNWTSKCTAAWSTAKAPIFATSTGSMNVVDRKCILPLKKQQKKSRICMKPFWKKISFYLSAVLSLKPTAHP